MYKFENGDFSKEALATLFIPTHESLCKFTFGISQAHDELIQEKNYCYHEKISSYNSCAIGKFPTPLESEDSLSQKWHCTEVDYLDAMLRCMVMKYLVEKLIVTTSYQALTEDTAHVEFTCYSDIDGVKITIAKFSFEDIPFGRGVIDRAIILFPMLIAVNSAGEIVALQIE